MPEQWTGNKRQQGGNALITNSNLKIKCPWSALPTDHLFLVWLRSTLSCGGVSSKPFPPLFTSLCPPTVRLEHFASLPRSPHLLCVSCQTRTEGLTSKDIHLHPEYNKWVYLKLLSPATSCILASCRFNSLTAKGQHTGRRRHTELMVADTTLKPATFPVAAPSHSSGAWLCTKGESKVNGDAGHAPCPLGNLAQSDFCTKIHMLT